MGQECTASLMNDFLKQKIHKIASMWETWVRYTEKNDKSLEQKRKEWIRDSLNYSLGSTFEIGHDITKNKRLTWAHNQKTAHQFPAVCFYLPLEEGLSLRNKKQETYFFWGILLALQVIQWTKDPSFCRVFWILEERTKGETSTPQFALQKLSLKGKFYHGLVLDKGAESPTKQETWASRFLDCSDPELILNSETDMARSFAQNGHRMIGCRLQETLCTTKEEDSLCLTNAERIGSFLIRMLSGLGRSSIDLPR
ncbi:hypothetical protein [Candidatus Similichlamydia laticola]|uniref:Uncharacterized protein n=1 Tax=Candidatus Similichlamydia laticola TaxID=2170265 RepID=A0A369K9M9_9BACT|nr:hypothetical protein [Candidatus Similichlamydia laticola]RDB31309.1 hypothetical protein HAT2_00588 [Candidatus Similichlamydia laticola]